MVILGLKKPADTQAESDGITDDELHAVGSHTTKNMTLATTTRTPASRRKTIPMLGAIPQGTTRANPERHLPSQKGTLRKVVKDVMIMNDVTRQGPEVKAIIQSGGGEKADANKIGKAEVKSPNGSFEKNNKPVTPNFIAAYLNPPQSAI